MRVTLLVAALPLVAGCVDSTALQDALCSQWNCLDRPGLRVTGTVRIGPHYADEGEAIVYLYEPADTVHAIESVAAYWPGAFTVNYWRDPGRDVCALLARAVLWNGDETELQPLFKAPPKVCDPNGESYAGADFLLDAYPPLAAPFVIRGRTLADDVPTAMDVSVVVRDTVDTPGLLWRTVRSNAAGEYRLETLDMAQRFSWCRATLAEVPRGDGVLRAGLGRVDDAFCTDSLRLPDLRLGAYHAVTGRVRIFDGGPNGRLADPGEATVTLLDPADSSAVGDRAEILADRTYDLWYPASLGGGGFPGCDWLLKVELRDGRSSTAPLRSPGSTLACSEWWYRDLLVE